MDVTKIEPENLLDFFMTKSIAIINSLKVYQKDLRCNKQPKREKPTFVFFQTFRKLDRAIS